MSRLGEVNSKKLNGIVLLGATVERVHFRL